MDAPEVTPPEHVPPKVVSREAKRAAGEEPSTASLPATRPIGRLDRRMAAGEFPVLEAFQQFLEHERQRARRQMLLLTSVAVVAVVVLVVMGGVIGFILYRDLGRDMQGVAGRIEAVESQSRNLQTTTLQAVGQAVEQAVDQAVGQAVGTAVGEAVGGATDALRRDTVALRKDLEQRSAGQSEVIESYENTLATMRAKLAELETQNQSVVGELDSVRAVIPSLSADMGVVVDLLAALNEPPDPEPAMAALAALPQGAPPAVALAPSATAAPAVALSLSITPAGFATPVPWTLLIPE